MSDDPRRPDADEELVREDDAIIGKAFRWSLLVIVLVAVVAVAGFVLTRKPDAEEQVLAKEVGPIEELVQDSDEMPEVAFRDVTAEAGIDFVHTNGATGDKLLPETIGGGVAVLRYDDDEFPDLLFVNSTAWPGAAQGAFTPALYRNDGVGKFDDVTVAARGYSTSSSILFPFVWPFMAFLLKRGLRRRQAKDEKKGKSATDDALRDALYKDGMSRALNCGKGILVEACWHRPGDAS